MQGVREMDLKNGRSDIYVGSEWTLISKVFSFFPSVDVVSRDPCMLYHPLSTLKGEFNADTRVHCLTLLYDCYIIDHLSGSAYS